MCVLGVEGSEKKYAAHPPQVNFWNSPYAKCTLGDGESGLWNRQHEVIVELPQSLIPGL